MKRILFGIVVMGSMVGLGSVGVYFAQKKFVPVAAAPVEQEPRRLPEAREIMPTPIRLASQSRQVSNDVSSTDPYARGAEPVAVVDDRYTPADRTGEPRVLADDPRANEIPNASELMANDEIPPAAQRSPFGAGGADEAEPRYAERPAAAQVAEESVAEEQIAEEPIANEPTPAVAGRPRPLASRAAKTDRYGREIAEAAIPAAAIPAAAVALREDEQDQRAAEPLAAEEAPVEDPVSNSIPPAAAPLAAEYVPEEQPANTNSIEGTGRPGDPQLSGSQAPTLTIEKQAPAEIQIGKPAKFVIKVRNAGTATAQGVEIHDTIPQGTQLIDTVPPAKRGDDGSLVWELGALKPGDEQTAELQLMPTAEGEIGSVATVHFRAEASVRTMATKPMLTMEVLGPSKVMKGEQVALKIKLSNPGSGSATGIMLTETVPQGLTHEGGKELELEIGTLKPGETRELDLALLATTAGTVTNTVTAVGEGNLKAESQTEVEVVAAQLQVALTGPKRRYLERKAVHNISVSNPGTAAAKEIQLTASIPRTLKFVEANNGGVFDEATRTVHWSLEELPPQETGTVTLTTLPLEAGEAKLLIKSAAQADLKAEREETVAIEGLAAINFQLSDVNDPVEVNGETSYEIRVTNQGSKAATNVRLVANLPPGLKPLSAEGPVRHKIEGQRVVFDPLRQLAPKADTAFTIKVKALEVGDLRIQAEVSTDEIRDPISKEEGTRVYGDE